MPKNYQGSLREIVKFIHQKLDDGYVLMTDKDMDGKKDYSLYDNFNVKSHSEEVQDKTKEDI